MKNKKGEEQLFSLWWAIVVAFVAVALIAGVTMFYSAEVDVRKVEASILSNKIKNCFLEDNRIKEVVLSEDFDIFSSCGLDKEIFSEGSNYFVSVKILDKSGKMLTEEIRLGDSSFEKSCEVKEGKFNGEKIRANNLPECVYENFYFFKNEEEGEMRILTASNQKGRKFQDG